MDITIRNQLNIKIKYIETKKKIHFATRDTLKRNVTQKILKK